jgi:hypothetical protein
MDKELTTYPAHYGSIEYIGHVGWKILREIWVFDEDCRYFKQND